MASDKSCANTDSGETKLKPSEVRFSQDSITCSFRNGKLLTFTFAHLLVGNLSVSDLPLIECIRKGRKWYATSGNRRLFLYKNLEDAGVVKKVPVKVIFTPKMKFKPTTKCDGKSIRISRGQLRSEIAMIISQWEKGEDIIAKWGVDNNLLATRGKEDAGVNDSDAGLFPEL